MIKTIATLFLTIAMFSNTTVVLTRTDYYFDLSFEKSMFVEECVITEYKSEDDENFLWEILVAEAPNEYIAAGILAYFWRESNLRSDCVVGWDITKAHTGEDPCAEFTEMLDSASKDEFITIVRRAGGYGLGQWYSEVHLEEMYDYCKRWKTSFADAEMQCMFTIYGCMNNPDIWELLKDANSAASAGRIIGSLYDGSYAAADVISARADSIYKERCK